MGITTIDFPPEMGSFHQSSHHISEENCHPLRGSTLNLQSALIEPAPHDQHPTTENISGLISKKLPLALPSATAQDLGSSHLLQ